MSVKKMIAAYGTPFPTKIWSKPDRAWIKKFEAQHMIMWDIPDEINKAIPALPNKIYVNKIIVVPLEKVFRQLIADNLHHEIKTWDGCLNYRRQRGAAVESIHCWGTALDINAAWNPLVKVGALDRKALRKVYCQFSEAFLQVWRDHGFTCGADWVTVIDPMHMEYTNV